MESLFLLLPISLLIITIAIFALRWAIRSGQYDDLEREGSSILFDDDENLVPLQRLPDQDALEKSEIIATPVRRMQAPDGAVEKAIYSEDTQAKVDQHRPAALDPSGAGGTSDRDGSGHSDQQSTPEFRNDR